MNLLFDVRGASLSFGDTRLFDNVSLTVHEGERLGIIGANGVGKSSFLRLMTGEYVPDAGTVNRRKGLRIGIVEQTPEFDEASAVEDVVADYIARNEPSEAENEVERQVKASIILGKLGFEDGRKAVGTLSGGWLKRLALAVALVRDPHVLLFDEPTNHLDIEGILWLEQWLRSCRAASVVISHDRAFLEATATKIVELDRSYPEGLLISEGGYSRFLERRAVFRQTQAKVLESLENKVRNEIEWLKQGAKARASKDKLHTGQAYKLIEELADMRRRADETRVGIDFTASGRKTKRLLVGRNLAKSRGGKTLFQGLDLLLKPGLKLGLVGANGSGKTTLLKILAGQLDPDEGEIRRADNLKVVVFDQQRETLDPSLSLGKALCEDGDGVVFREKVIHVASWAKRFGFDTRQLDTPVGRLSGGEQAKIQIARLMLEAADVLLLDEPTNDLDLPTLEILERNLAEFPGALVLVTHDRYMLDQLSSVLIGLDSRGNHHIVADYAQWLDTLEELREDKKEKAPPKTEKKSRNKQRSKKLSYLEQREYDGLEAAILEAEEKVSGLESLLANPEVASDPTKAEEAYNDLQQAKETVDALYLRWEELEEKQA